jgi:hypothetical protein
MNLAVFVLPADRRADRTRLGRRRRHRGARTRARHGLRRRPDRSGSARPDCLRSSGCGGSDSRARRTGRNGRRSRWGHCHGGRYGDRGLYRRTGHAESGAARRCRGPARHVGGQPHNPAKGKGQNRDPLKAPAGATNKRRHRFRRGKRLPRFDTRNEGLDRRRIFPLEGRGPRSSRALRPAFAEGRG